MKVVELRDDLVVVSDGATEFTVPPDGINTYDLTLGLGSVIYRHSDGTYHLRSQKDVCDDALARADQMMDEVTASFTKKKGSDQ
jgi:hypothetical protein